MGERSVKYLLLFLSIISFNAYADARYTSPRVVDGDTIEFKAAWVPAELGEKIKVRVLGVDTPEKAPRAKCQQEADRAAKASTFTTQLVSNAKVIEVKVKGWDKYGGRVLGDIYIDGKNLKDELIKNNLAREYFGETKQSWCN